MKKKGYSAKKYWLLLPLWFLFLFLAASTLELRQHSRQSQFSFCCMPCCWPFCMFTNGIRSMVIYKSITPGRQNSTEVILFPEQKRI